MGMYKGACFSSSTPPVPKMSFSFFSHLSKQSAGRCKPVVFFRSCLALCLLTLSAKYTPQGCMDAGSVGIPIISLFSSLVRSNVLARSSSKERCFLRNQSIAVVYILTTTSKENGILLRAVEHHSSALWLEH
jgi:hypothetical protein